MGRDFTHPQTQWTLDLVADAPYVDKRPIKEFDTLRTRFGPIRLLKLEDAIADRIAAFLHWNDSQSLEIARMTVAAARPRVDRKALHAALDQLDATAPGAPERLDLARRTLGLS